MQQIRSSQAEMCWRNNRSSTWDCWARLDQIWLVCFFSHLPPFYSFPIFQASASLCCRTCGWGVEIWHRGSDSVVLWCNKFAPAKLRCVEETIEDSTWDCWARLDQIWLVCFFSHLPPFYSFPIFQASASLCCRTCGWVLKFDIGVVTQCAMIQQIRSSQAEMCWRNNRSSTWDCWARLDQIWLVCFFSHLPPFYSFPIFQASASCCRTCGWVLKFDIGVVTQ